MHIRPAAAAPGFRGVVSRLGLRRGWRVVSPSPALPPSCAAAPTARLPFCSSLCTAATAPSTATAATRRRRPTPNDRIWAANARLQELLAEERVDEAFDEYLELSERNGEGCTPSAHTFRNMIVGTAAARRPDLMQALHRDMMHNGLLPSPPIVAALLETYGRYRNPTKVGETVRWMERAGVDFTIAVFAKLTFAKALCKQDDEAFSVMENYREAGLPCRLFYNILFSGFEPKRPVPSPIDGEMRILRSRLLTNLVPRLEASNFLTDDEVAVFVNYCVHSPGSDLQPSYDALMTACTSPVLLPRMQLAVKHKALKLLAKPTLAAPHFPKSVALVERFTDELLSAGLEVVDRDGDARAGVPSYRLVQLLFFFVHFEQVERALGIACHLETAGVQVHSHVWLLKLRDLVNNQAERAAVEATADPSVEHVPDFEGYRAAVARFETTLLRPESKQQFHAATVRKHAAPTQAPPAAAAEGSP